MESHWFILLLFPLLEETDPTNLAKTYVSVLPMFSSRSFMASGLILKCLIHFEVIFLDGMRKDSSLILVHVAVQFSQHHLSKRLYFPHCILSPPLS